MGKKVKEKSIEQLEKEARLARRAYMDAEKERKNKEVLPLLRKMKGQCFKYHNSYGGDHDRWWLYCKVESVDEKNYNLNVVEFQKTSMDIAEVRWTKKFSYNGKIFFGENSGYYKISSSEYNRAKKQMLTFIQKTLSI